MSKYCEQCGAELGDKDKFCNKCGAKCNNIELNERPKKKSDSKNKKIIVMCGVILCLLTIGFVTGFFSDLIKVYNKVNLTADGTAYQMTVQEYCDRFNEIADESWCSGDEELLRIQVEEESRNSLEEAAAYDSEVEDLLIQTMTPSMIVDETLLRSEDTDELPNGENYLKYTYTNQFSFIPDNIGVQILTKKDTEQIVGIAAKFPMDYRNVGGKFGKLICDSFGKDTDEFQELYNKMKQAGGYGHMYKDGTVFELMYYENSDKNALFKMSACTEEHYEEAWVNNPDLPTADKPATDLTENSAINNDESTDISDSGYYSKISDDIQITENINSNEPVDDTDNTSLNYIFPDSDKAYLNEMDLWQYSSEELELGRNEIFARHGRIFNTDYIRDYFESQSWYHGTIAPDEFDANMESRLNEYEKANIETIKFVENVKNQRGNP